MHDIFKPHEKIPFNSNLNADGLSGLRPQRTGMMSSFYNEDGTLKQKINGDNEIQEAGVSGPDALCGMGGRKDGDKPPRFAGTGRSSSQPERKPRATGLR